jgi:vacuolar-type H+-ATPase subunit E/Vma4
MKNLNYYYIGGGILGLIIILIVVRSIVYAIAGDPKEKAKAAAAEAKAEAAANAGKQESTSNTIDDQIRKAESIGKKRLWSEVKLRSAADSLENAMRGMGTNIEPIEEIFKTVRSELDILYIIKYFGVRDGEDLAEWLEDDGMTDEVNAIMKRRGVKNIIF